MNIRSLCLGILFFEDATGYEINKLASDGRYSHFIEASYGSIYPALTKLTAEGLVTFRQEQQDGKPTRKVYSITDLGRQSLRAYLHEAPKQDVFKSEFLFICLYARVLGPENMQKVVNERITTLEKRLEEFGSYECHACSPGSQFALGYGHAIHHAALEYMRNNRHLLEQTTPHNPKNEDENAPQNRIETTSDETLRAAE